MRTNPAVCLLLQACAKGSSYHSCTALRHAQPARQARPIMSLRGGAQQRSLWLRGSAPLAAANQAPSPPTADPALPLQLTAFVFVLGTSLVTLTPAPHLVQTLGVDKGIRLLTVLATTSAGAEIALSPLVGGLTDSVGRKSVLVGTLVVAWLANLATAVYPTVALIALSKFVSSLVVGIFFLAAGAILADSFRSDPARLASASGLLFALVNAAFGLGVAVSGFMPSGLRFRYGVSAAVSLGGVVLAALGVRESMAVADRLPFELKAFNPLGFTRLLAMGRKMRLLAALAALSLAPLFMGDTLQVFAISQWRLSDAQVSQLFTLVAVSGVVANSVGGVLIQRMGLQLFTALATASTLVFWAGFASGDVRAALACAALGVLGPARTLGATTMMTAEGARLNVPQGQLSGDRANMVAWLKVLGPLVYGQLYVRGLAAGVPQLPFFLNVVLTAAALVLGRFALAT